MLYICSDNRYLLFNLVKMNIYIANLSFRVGNDGLKELFEAYGTVASARVITDKNSGRSRGFGFVEMPNDEEAAQAIKELNQSEVEGRVISVSEARPPKDYNNRAPR